MVVTIVEDASYVERDVVHRAQELGSLDYTNREWLAAVLGTLRAIQLYGASNTLLLELSMWCYAWAESRRGNMVTAIGYTPTKLPRLSTVEGGTLMVMDLLASANHQEYSTHALCELAGGTMRWLTYHRMMTKEDYSRYSAAELSSGEIRAVRALLEKKRG